MRRLLFALAWVLCMALVIPAAPLPAKEKGPRIKDLADTIDNNLIMTKFAAMVRAADLGTFLSSKGPFTVFVPTDSAFATLPPGMLELLLQPQNKERLQDIVLFHVINGKRLTMMDMAKLKTVMPCQGPPLLLKVSRGGAQYVMKAKVTFADIKCANGVINEVDSLIMPPDSALPPLSTTPPPAPAPPATNSAGSGTNAAPAATNAAPSAGDTNNIPVAPVAKPADQ